MSKISGCVDLNLLLPPIIIEGTPLQLDVVVNDDDDLKIFLTVNVFVGAEFKRFVLRKSILFILFV